MLTGRETTYSVSILRKKAIDGDVDAHSVCLKARRLASSKRRLKKLTPYLDQHKRQNSLLQKAVQRTKTREAEQVFAISQDERRVGQQVPKSSKGPSSPVGKLKAAQEGAPIRSVHRATSLHRGNKVD